MQYSLAEIVISGYFLCCFKIKVSFSRDNSVNWFPMGWTAAILLAVGAEFVLFSPAHKPAVGPGREANHSRPSSAEIKNTGALPPVFYE
jgi:hypothetical protein